MPDPELRPGSFPATRWSLIGRLGDDAVPVVELYAPAVEAYLRQKLRGRASPNDTDDVVQEVLAHLLTHPELLQRAQPGSGSRFRHYLMTLAWNEARNALRRRRPSGSTVGLDALSAAASSDTALADRAWARTVLDQAWREVAAWCSDGTAPAETFSVLRRHLVDGVALRAAAPELGLSLATASRRLALGRTLLQQALTDRLRAAGELGEHEDGAAAWARLNAALSG